MFAIVGKYVEVETPIIKTSGIVVAYSPGSILLEVDWGADKEGREKPVLQQVISPNMIVTLVK